ncbi:hypothetical protein ACFQ0M_49200 [Kitasatospora aburaviensis]
MPYITVLLNRKGGVGKSLLSVNLAAVYAEILGCNPDAAAGDGPSVAVVSIDPQGTSIEHAEKVRKAGRPVPFRVVDASQSIDKLRRLRSAKADIIIVDTPGFMPLKADDDEDESIDPSATEPPETRCEPSSTLPTTSSSPSKQKARPSPRPGSPWSGS